MTQSEPVSPINSPVKSEVVPTPLTGIVYEVPDDSGCMEETDSLCTVENISVNDFMNCDIVVASDEESAVEVAIEPLHQCNSEEPDNHDPAGVEDEIEVSIQPAQDVVVSVVGLGGDACPSDSLDEPDVVTLVAESECNASSCVEEQCLTPVSPTTTSDVMDADMVDDQMEVAVSVSGVEQLDTVEQTLPEMNNEVNEIASVVIDDKLQSASEQGLPLNFDVPPIIENIIHHLHQLYLHHHHLQHSHSSHLEVFSWFFTRNPHQSC